MQPDSKGLSVVARRVLRSADPYAPEFSPDVPAHTLLAPTNGSMLDRTQFYSVGKAHEVEGAGSVYVITIADHLLDFSCGEKNGCYPIDFGDPHTYFSTDYRAYHSVDNLILPISGKWAILIADEGHAVVAGSQHFVDTMLTHCTLSVDEMALLFVRRRKELRDIGLPSLWLDSFLEAIYGPKRAARLAALESGEEHASDQAE